MRIPATSPADLISFAIGREICVLATYNRSEATLAPHSLFERDGEKFMKAVTVETDGRIPKVLKMGTFKLAGLSDIRLSSRTFAAGTLFSEVEATRRRLEAAARRGPRDRRQVRHG